METPGIFASDAGAAASPPGPLFARVCSPETLRTAWAKVQANAGAAGGDGITLERFAHLAEVRIEFLVRSLRRFG